MQRATLIAGATAALVVPGLLLGVQWDNLHNGLLALSFAAVGVFVLGRRPRQREALLFLATGLAHAVMFLGRQVGGAADSPFGTSLTAWVAWLGIWPLPLVLLIVGATVMCFPDGRFPSRRWFLAFLAMAAAASVLAVMSAGWPVDYDRAGLRVDHPLDLPGRDAAIAVFGVLRPLVLTAFQVLWLACVVARFRHASSLERRQLRWLVGVVGLSVLVLVTGLAVTGSPRAGLLTTPLIPLAAGVAIVEASYEAMLRELRDSARRVVTAQDEARRRIERDLHDGAQHRLVVLGMDLGRVVERAQRSGDPELASAASAAREQLLEATSELRDLARGIHPSALARDGLRSALESLAESSEVPVELHVAVDPRCPEDAAATAYFVVSEALTNAVRHSGATRVRVEARTTASMLRLEVADDGRGGAVPGGGLRGLVDRVTSLGGRLTVDSPRGRGTRITMELPCP